jgi:membrane protease YdiL (CAAX protease family)
MEPVLYDDSSQVLRRTLGFIVFLYTAWIGAWLVNRALAQRTDWLATSGGRFAYWQIMKLLLGIVPALLLLRTSGLRLRDVVGITRVRSVILWGGGAGLVFVASALIADGMNHQPLFPPHPSWPFVGGVIVAPIVEEITFRGAVLPSLLMRYRFTAANTITAPLFLGIHLPGWYFQGCLSDMLRQPIGGALSILVIGWVLGPVAYKSKSVAASTLTHVLNNLFSAV